MMHAKQSDTPLQALSNSGLDREKRLKPPCGMDAEEATRVEQMRNFLCSYQLCIDMLNLRKYERRRAHRFHDPCICDEVLMGNEQFWRSRIMEVGRLIDSMPNGREKLLLYYHYVHGETVEHIGKELGVSVRTSYRLHGKALRRAAELYRRMQEQRQQKMANMP